MNDLEPFDPSRDLAGPTLTVVRDDPDAFAGLTQRRRSRTRLAVLVADPGGHGDGTGSVDASRLVAAVPSGFEPELVMAAGRDLGAPSGTVAASGWSWQLVAAGQGRADTLDRLTAECTGDFIVVPHQAEALGLMPVALGHLWVQGADAVVVSTEPDPRRGPGAAAGAHGERTSDPAGEDRDAARRLAEVLGLRSATGPRPLGMVVLRRWVARFLLDELGRAIDAAEELGERARLMELRLVEVVAPAD